MCSQQHAGWVKIRDFYVPDGYCTRVVRALRLSLTQRTKTGLTTDEARVRVHKEGENGSTVHGEGDSALLRDEGQVIVSQMHCRRETKQNELLILIK